MTQGLARLDRTSLSYEMIGNGPPLVLISGGGILDKRAWDDQFQAFGEFHKVVRYDIRGIGQSTRPLESFSHSQDLCDLLEFLDVEKAQIIGLSFGGAIAIDFAIEHPDRVDSMVLAATGTSTDAKAEDNLKTLAGLSSMAKEEGLPHVVELILGTRSFISMEHPHVRERLRQIYLDNHDVFESDFPFIRLWQPAQPPACERLSEILSRVLILQGENDSPAYKSMGDKLLSIAGARRVVIAGAGHAINLDQPDAFNQAVLEFLRNSNE
jgi:3-oxoadipate enol-lactonase